MKLIVGLGNPGNKYEKTRHNVGWMVLDALAGSINSKFEIRNPKQIKNNKFEFKKQFNVEILKIGDTILAKPQTFMNDSGIAVKTLSGFYKIKPEDIFIIHDDLDIKLGEYKIQKGKGPKVHNGVNSVEEELGTKDFWRVRVGIENRMPNDQLQMLNEERGRISGEVYTLQDFDETEAEMKDGVIGEIVTKLI